MLAVATRRIAIILVGEKHQPSLKHHPWNVHVSAVFSWTIAFRQTKRLLSLNWQVSKVLIVKFQASILDQCYHLLINLSWKSACKPLNAISARSAILQLSKKSSRPALRLPFYTVFARFGCTTTQHVQSKPSRHFALKQWLPTK